MVGKNGHFGKVIAGKFSIWREILTIEIKKYIRNSGKSDFLAGKNTFFQAVVDHCVQRHLIKHLASSEDIRQYTNRSKSNKQDK